VRRVRNRELPIAEERAENGPEVPSRGLGLRGPHGLVQRRQGILAKEELDPLERAAALLAPRRRGRRRGRFAPLGPYGAHRRLRRNATRSTSSRTVMISL
jgi:hypothetical protein